MADLSMGVEPENYWRVECYRDGRLLWVDEFPNLVTTAGKNKLLDAALKSGSAAPTWYIGLVDNASFSAYAAADTAGSHAGWIESVIYSDGTRQAFTPGAVAAGSVDNSAAKATFNINGSGTVRGMFIIDNSTKSGTTGTLYGEGDFASARVVANADQLVVTVTATA